MLFFLARAKICSLGRDPSSPKRNFSCLSEIEPESILNFILGFAWRDSLSLGRKRTREHPIFSLYSRLSEICRKICIISSFGVKQKQFLQLIYFKSNLHYINYTNQPNFPIQTKTSTINHLYQNQHIHILFQTISCITHKQSILQTKFGTDDHVTLHPDLLT